MRALIDNDVLLDVALARSPFVQDSAAVLAWAADGGDAVVAWHSLTNCIYLLKGGGRMFVNDLIDIVRVARTSTADARRALTLSMSDLEDAFQVAAALAEGVDLIITRNVHDYRNSPIEAVTPTAFLLSFT